MYSRSVPQNAHGACFPSAPREFTGSLDGSDTDRELFFPLIAAKPQL